MYRESSSTPVLDTEEYRQRYKQYAEDGLETGDYEQYPSGKFYNSFCSQRIINSFPRTQKCTTIRLKQVFFSPDDCTFLYS